MPRGLRRRGGRTVGFYLCLTSLLCGPVRAATVTQIEFIGEARVPVASSVDELPVGGLSGIAYDADRDRFYVVSDDPSGRGPARFYTIEVDLALDRLGPEAVRVLGTTLIRSPSGGTPAKLSLDPEGIVLMPDDGVFISSEGQIKRQVGLWIRRFGLDGSFQFELPLPKHFRPTRDGTAGPRHNLGFEGLGVTPDGRYLFAGMENALYQDGPAASLEGGSPSRLLQFDTAAGELVAEYVYWTEPVARAATVPDGLEVNGLVEVLAMDEARLLTLERSYSAGAGNTVRIFEVDLSEATDISGYAALEDIDLGSIVPVAKSLLLDLRELDLYLDNLEGMCFGPTLSDGRQSLLLIADDNFNPLVQVGQVLAFALDDDPVTVETVQGRSHRSPLEGRWVLNLEAVVTLVDAVERGGFWVEAIEADADPATSRGLYVRMPEGLPAVGPGDSIEVDGRVLEVRRRDGELTTTTLEARALRRLDTTAQLSGPVRVGRGGRRVPSAVIDDDGRRFFEPRFDGLDFWESLEGMRIEISRPQVIGPSNRYGDLTILADDHREPASRTSAGGLLLRPGDANPERLIVNPIEDGDGSWFNVGDRFDADLVGVLGYDYGSYRLYTKRPLPSVTAISRSKSTSSHLDPGASTLTIASFNVYNLSARSDAARFVALARQLVGPLAAPAIVALQEIQDDSGPEDDGTVTAHETLTSLVAAVEAAGGPRYRWRQIDPGNNSDGGAPGANIRVAFLFDPVRVGFDDRGAAGAWDRAVVERQGESVKLNANPVRLAPRAAAFAEDSARGFSASRKPLVAELTFGEERLFLVNLHLSSKSGDERLFGAAQPPQRHSEDQRSQQARIVADFVSAIQAVHPQANVVVLGDLNEHEFRSPLRTLEAAGLENPLWELPVEERYSFVYKGNSQVLDHILVSRSLKEKAGIELEIVHLNADFADASRASDHDPILLSLDFSGGD